MPTLNLTPKIKNSPTLAVKKFIHDHFLYFGKGSHVMTTQKLWGKFQINEEYSTVIKNFDMDFLMFKEIAEPILEVLQLNEIRLNPVFKIITKINLRTYQPQIEGVF
jgi:hypothetical protein